MAEVPPGLAARVLFASDRTCCVCRLENSKVQIHHIDKDHDNNDFDNLAVICLECHSDAHTTGAFVRNLTPELVTLYNRSWRELVSLRLLPGPQSSQKVEFAAEAFLEASLVCHAWKVHFMALLGGQPPKGSPGAFPDVWDLMLELWIPPYSEENYKRFLPLFDQGIRDLQRELDRLIQLFPDVLPYDFRVLLVRARRQLQAERIAYVTFIPHMAEYVPPERFDVMFVGRFDGVIRVLREVARQADKRREEVSAPPA